MIWKWTIGRQGIHLRGEKQRRVTRFTCLIDSPDEVFPDLVHLNCKRKHTSLDLKLLLVSKQVCEEARDVLFTDNTFYFTGPNEVLDLGAKLCRHRTATLQLGLRKVRHIDFTIEFATSTSEIDQAFRMLRSIMPRVNTLTLGIYRARKALPKKASTKSHKEELKAGILQLKCLPLRSINISHFVTRRAEHDLPSERDAWDAEVTHSLYGYRPFNPLTCDQFLFGDSVRTRTIRGLVWGYYKEKWPKFPVSEEASLRMAMWHVSFGPELRQPLTL